MAIMSKKSISRCFIVGETVSEGFFSVYFLRHQSTFILVSNSPNQGMDKVETRLEKFVIASSSLKTDKGESSRTTSTNACFQHQPSAPASSKSTEVSEQLEKEFHIPSEPGESLTKI
jgi:hypothetical protein